MYVTLLCPVLFMRARPQATYTANAVVALVGTAPWRRHVHGGLTPVSATFRQPTRGLLASRRRTSAFAPTTSFGAPKRWPCCHYLWWHHVCGGGRGTPRWSGRLTSTVRRRSRNQLLLLLVVLVLLLLALPSFFKLTHH